MEMGEKMKKFIFGVLVVGILAALVLGISYYFNEEHPTDLDSSNLESVGDLFKEEDGYDIEDDFSKEIKEIDIVSLNGAFTIEKASFDGIKIKNKSYRNIDYDFTDGKLKVEDTKSKEEVHSIESLLKKDIGKVKICSKNPEEIYLKINQMNGALAVDSRLKKMEIDVVNGYLSVNSEDSFDTAVQEINGAAEIDMDKIDSRIKIERVNGEVKLSFDDVNSFQINNFDKTLGSGRDLIDFGTVNGFLKIDE